MTNYCHLDNCHIPIDVPPRWTPSLQQPYPSTYHKPITTSPQNQVMVYYNGKPQYGQTVKTNVNCNPQTSWERKHTVCPVNYQLKNNAIMYPTTHSIAGPYLQSYIALPNKMYQY